MKNLLSLCLIMLTVFTFLPAEAQEKQSIFDVSSSSLFSNDDEFLKVEQAFSFNFYQKNNLLEVSFDIAPGYYLYRHQFKFKGKEVKFTQVTLPSGIDHEDEFFGVKKIFTEHLSFTINLEHVDSDGNIKLTYQGCAEKGLCYPPTSKVIELSNIDANESFPFNPTSLSQSKEVNTAEKQNITPKSEQHQLADMLKQDSLLLTLIAFFVGGLLLSFTPCVFPMYPILTGIIVGQGKQLTTKKAFTLSFFYVQGMAITYTLLGIVVALAGAKFQAVFQHPSVLIGLSVLFIFLAL